MKLFEVQQELRAELVCGSEWVEREVGNVCGAGLMSDVLACTKERTLLLTGLNNIQVVRTAEMSDLVAIVFVCGKRPGPELVKLARMKGIPLFVAECCLYEACGILYKNGLISCHKRGECRE